MNKRQESTNSMFLAVRDFLNGNSSITTALPNFTLFFTAFLNALLLIKKFSEQQIFDRSGLKDAKDLLRKALVKISADVSRKLQAYAEFIGDLVLAAETKYSETQLSEAADTKLRDISMFLYNRVESNLEALEPYGLTAQTQTAYLAAINSFDAAIPTPKLGTTNKKQSTEELKEAFKVGNESLDKLDALVEIVRLTEPGFYVGYKSARKPRNSGNVSLAVKGLVVDSVTGLPIKGVNILFFANGTTNTNPVLTKKSAIKGGFNVKTLAPGMYTVIIRKFGFVEQTVTIAVSQGEMTELKIELKKIEL